MKKIAYIACLSVMLAGCVDLERDLPKPEVKIVIDGVIEQGAFPIVYLTLSSGFYDPVDSSSLLDLIVTTARVSVSDGEQEEVLTLFRSEEFFPPYYYRGTDLRGETGKTYTLEVRSRGEVYTAVTTIPEPVALDSIWFEKDTSLDSLGNIWIELSDDAAATNYYRVFTWILGSQSGYIPSYQSTLSDRTFNGTVFRHPILKRPDDFTSIGNEIFFTEGDTVNLKFCHLDMTHFDFWRTLEQELYSVGNPFGSAGNQIATNITGTKAALGVWGGYGASYYQIILK